MSEDILGQTKPAPKHSVHSDLDRADILYVENSVLKEQNESYRHEFRNLQLKNDRGDLHDFFVRKYKIDLNVSTFTIVDGKTIIITAK